MKKCPKCGKQALEVVDVHYDLEAELERKHPVEVEIWVCAHCGHQEKVEIE